MKKNIICMFLAIVFAFGFIGCGSFGKTNDSVTAVETITTAENITLICQSCEMPMDEAAKFGTDADGSRSDYFCTHCWRNGRFTAPNLTFDEAVEFNIPFVIRAGIAATEDEARAMIRESMSKLKRWAED